VTFDYRIDRVTDAGSTRLASASTMLIALDGNGATRRMPSELVEKLRAAIAP
jgi:acyl-CoA thioesterase FadM